MKFAELARNALDTTLELREEIGIPFGTPLNIWDICEKLQPRIRVRFADYSMEGCYHRSERPLIEISALRPLGRRAFNTAHELGHHWLGHSGSRVDQQIARRDASAVDPDEFSANAFAGYLLMPKLGVRRAFSTRGWTPATASPEQLFTVACHFGVGYQTLVSHLAHGLQEISTARAHQLERIKLPAIRKTMIGSTPGEVLWVADKFYVQPTIDTEVGTTLLLPPGSHPEFSQSLSFTQDVDLGRVFTVRRPGITRVVAPGWAVLVRAARFQYSGWSTNRHLEPDESDEND